MKMYAQTQRKHQIQEDENFNRPEPSKPIQPQVPNVNRYQDDKVFLEYADSLYKQQNRRDTVEKQILKGNVKFRQAGLWMFCDSAYYYPEENSLDAFSNVRMEQGDTLFVYADQLFYDGDLHLAKLKNGPTREKVTLINKDVTLTTDSLDYDMNLDLGWYTRWGTLDDKVNTLTSLYGEYSPNTKKAQFFHDVELVNNKDGYTMLTDTLYYSTETHIAEVESRTLIQGANDTIITNLATYYTDSGNADLLSRSTIIHKDSTGNIITLEGDSIIYDNATRISRAYMFRDPFKRSAPMVITDTAQKTTLIGGFGIYNDSTKEALATIYPLLMEYSQGDTLFLRADTIKTFIVTEMVPDKRRKTKSGFPEFNGVPTVRYDSTGIWIDSTFFRVEIPYADAPIKMLIARMKADQDKAAKKAKPQPQPIITPQNSDDNKEKTVNNDDTTLKPDTLLTKLEGVDSISSQGEFLTSELVGEVIDSLGMDVRENLDSIGRIAVEGLDSISPSDGSKGGLIEAMVLSEDEIPVEDKELLPDSIPYEYHVALAYHRGRFFKQDMQGVADSMVFVEKDSMLYLFRKPIVWSEERQVTGNRIDVHFNDSTTDWAYLPEFGLISEYVDEDFYNQIFGKEITAYFEGQGLRRMNVSGNVETIFLPQEEDSTFNRLVNAESSYLDAYLSENKLERMKMWPEVSGTVTPLFLVKRNQMYLQKFKWWGFLRPEREWYGDRWHWADNLGEVPDELEQYFLAPSDFGEPKSFSGTRFSPPPTSLPVVLDSLETSVDNINIPDSIDTGALSPGVEKIEKQETIGDILESEEEERQAATETEKESEEIENEIKNQDRFKVDEGTAEEETQEEEASDEEENKLEDNRFGEEGEE